MSFTRPTSQCHTNFYLYNSDRSKLMRCDEAAGFIKALRDSTPDERVQHVVVARSTCEPLGESTISHSVRMLTRRHLDLEKFLQILDCLKDPYSTSEATDNCMKPHL